MQPGQGFDQFAVLALPLAAGLFDVGQHLPHGVDHRQLAAGDFGRERQLAFAELAQQVLADVRHRLQIRESEEARRAFDRVNRAKDAGQTFFVVRIFFEVHQISIELVEVLVALDEELLDDLIHIAHGINPSARAALAATNCPAAAMATAVLSNISNDHISEC